MSKASKAWARRARVELLTRLGGRCLWCHCRDYAKLEFDCHPEPMGDRHHRGSTDQRMSFYRAQAAADNLRVLCSRCHNRASAGYEKDRDGKYKEWKARQEEAKKLRREPEPF